MKQAKVLGKIVGNKLDQFKVIGGLFKATESVDPIESSSSLHGTIEEQLGTVKSAIELFLENFESRGLKTSQIDIAINILESVKYKLNKGE